MNHISSLITPDTILLDLSFSSKQHLFEHAGNIFSQQHHLKSTDIFNSLSERERLGSTALGYGIAIPHGRIKGLNQAAGMLYRLQTPLEFDAPDAKPVTLCFLLLVPKEADEKHLQILGELAQLFGDEAMRSRMLSAQNPVELHALITAWAA
jgi:PTS system nitrogen regulatory IIA component